MRLSVPERSLRPWNLLIALIRSRGLLVKSWPSPARPRHFVEPVGPSESRTWTVAHLDAPAPFAAALVVAAPIDRVVRLSLSAE